METNKRFHFIFILFWIISACSPKITDRAEYKLDDVVYRKMRLTVYKDGRFTLDNNAAWWIGYSISGKWDLKNNNMFILIDQSKCIDSLKQIEYPRPGDTVNFVKLQKDPGYGTFPIIRTDTVQFSDDYKFAYLKGFQFEHNPRTAKLSRFLKTR